MNTAQLDRRHFAWLSIVAAIATIALKTIAWWVTGSVSLLSDALESLVNLAGASFALWMILITRVPADDEHPFGHSKAEYFSSGFEGVLIFGAAVANYGVAVALRNAGVRFHSIALEADSKHLMTDVWTSVGVVTGVVMVTMSGWLWIDPVVAIAVGLHIIVEGYRLVSASVHGMMDGALVEDRLENIKATLDAFAERDVTYKNLKTRRAGTISFIQVDILVPRQWTVGQGHDVLDEIESRLASIVPGANIVTHLEPRE